jgi:hypothetical protein
VSSSIISSFASTKLTFFAFKNKLPTAGLCMQYNNYDMQLRVEIMRTIIVNVTSITACCHQKYITAGGEMGIFEGKNESLNEV